MNKGVLSGAKQTSFVPPGIIWEYAGSSLPDPSSFGTWLWADGSLVSRSQYPDLFGAVGFAYSPTPGTDPGGNQFYLPNRKGRVGIGRDAGITEFDTLGETGGSKDAVVPAHAHTTSSGTNNSGTRNLQHYHGDDHYHGGIDHVHNDDHYHSWSSGPGDHGHAVGGSWGNVVGFRTDAAANGHQSGGLERETFTTVNASGNHAHNTNWSNETHGTVNTGWASDTSTNWKNEQGYGTTTNWATDPNDDLDSHSHTISIDSNGVSVTGARLPPYVVCNYIVKA